MADASVSQPGAPPAPSASPEVSWQTLFWIMTDLALNSMTQPCGKVCDTRSRYRMYLRSSPLICALDILFFFSDWIHTYLQSSFSITRTFIYVMEERFSDSSSADGIEGLRLSTWTRWLLFVLGPLPQAIRLASFKGVFWSKVLGFSFLVPWVIVELLVLIAGRSPTAETTIESRESRKLLHLSGTRRDKSQVTNNRIMSGLMTLSLASVVVYAETVFVIRAHIELNAFFLFVFVVLSFGLMVIVLLASLGIVFITFYIIFSGNPWLGTTLMVSTQNPKTEVIELDAASVLVLVFFLANAFFCILGYCWYYEGAGTINPGWTAVFG